MRECRMPDTFRLAGKLTMWSAVTLIGEAVWAVARPVPAFFDMDATGLEGDPSHPTLTVSVLGDSSCTGPGLADPSEIWIRQLGATLGRQYFVDIVSFAMGGARAIDVRRHQLDGAVERAADITFVSVGANDAIKGVGLTAFRDHLDAIVETLVPATGLVVLSGVGDLGTIPRLLPPLDRLLRARGKQMDEIHRQVGARYGAVVTDQWRWVAERFRDPAVFSDDLFHPTVLGHRLWAQVALETIEPHLPQIS